MLNWLAITGGVATEGDGTQGIPSLSGPLTGRH